MKRLFGSMRSLLVSLGLMAVGCGGGGGGVIDCPSHIDKRIACGLLPSDPQLREANIRICKNWDRTYKTTVTEALEMCTDVACVDLNQCISDANLLCQADVSAEQQALCGKITECGWEGLTTMVDCLQEMASVQMLHMCLKPEILAAYIDCVTSITCAQGSEDDWYACGFEHIGM